MASNYFHDCFTDEEIKDRYRLLAKLFHPDKGGTDEQFRELQEQYERTTVRLKANPPLPSLFSVDGDYEYFRSKVIYVSRDNHWYKFSKSMGAYVWIDADHTYLIKRKETHVY